MQTKYTSFHIITLHEWINFLKKASTPFGVRTAAHTQQISDNINTLQIGCTSLALWSIFKFYSSWPEKHLFMETIKQCCNAMRSNNYVRYKLEEIKNNNGGRWIFTWIHFVDHKMQHAWVISSVKTLQNYEAAE